MRPGTTPHTTKPTIEVLEITRLAFLAEAGAIVPRSLDEEITLDNIARVMIPFLADCSLLYLEESNQCIRRMGAAKQNQWPDLIRSRRFARRAAFTHAPELAKTIPAEWFEAFAETPEDMDEFQECGFQSAMRLPLIEGGTSLGVLLLLSDHRTYRPEDLVLALEISQRAASAIHNARMYSAALREARRFPPMGIAVLNHELRNLISPILGWARVFRQDRGVARNPILAEGAESLERNARHMSKLLNDCLELSEGTEGRLHMDWTVVDLNAVVSGAIDAVHQNLLAKHQGLRLEQTPGPLWVDGDADRLLQVAINVLSNAVKYSDAGSPIWVRSARVGGNAEIVVSDHGQGIASEDLPHIFEPFRRGTTAPHGGLGLGLAISRQIVTLHGGSIWAESEGPGEGASLHVTIPGTDREPIPGAIEEPSTLRGRSRHVLLVEDAADVRTLMKLQMEGMGHIVDAVTNVSDAIRHARRHAPDLIVSDIRLSGLGGFSLAKLLKSEAETASIPLLAVTGMGGGAGQEEARLAGFGACILKPVDDEDLAEWIDQLTCRRPV